MKIGAWLVIVGFLLWGTGSTYWYTCKIKQNCPEIFSFLQNQPSAEPEPVEANPLDSLSLAAYWNTPKTEVGKGFENLKNSLLARMGEFDTLTISGDHYSEEEAGPSMGMLRAEAVADLFYPFLDSARIKITTSEHIPEEGFNMNKPFEAVSFSITAGDAIAVVTEEEKANEGYVEDFGDKIIVHFPYASVVKLITPTIENALNQRAEELKGTSFRIDIIGHTDDRGSFKDNYWLGRKRAWALKAHLMKKGLDPIKLKTGSRGEREPIADNASEEGRAKNRRVELTIHKNP
jgi:outer membrane protein OmpA-like peptidoglycan-associated protein